MEHDRDALADVTLVLTDDEADRIRELCLRTAAELDDRPVDSEATLTAAELAGHALPVRLIRALIAFRCRGNALGTLAVVNLPIDRDLPATPADGHLPDWRALPVATLAQLAACSHLGDVIAYADEKRGQLVQDIVPVAEAGSRQENSGTVCLELHTEDGFHPFKPDFLALLCLRPDHERRARTLTGAIARILPRLSGTCVETLRQPLFRIRYSSSFARLGSTGYSAPIAVLSGPFGDPDMVADAHAMEPLTRGARAALEEFHAALEAALVSTVLEPGTMLFVDNRAAVHGRTAFRARYDGTDRWLRRCLTVADLRRSRMSRAAGSRVCAPLPVIQEQLGPAAARPLARSEA